MYFLSVAVCICAGVVYGNARSPPAKLPGPDACQAQMTAFPFDLSSKCCTHVSRAGDITVGKEDRATNILYQHPWAALIDYELKKTGSKKRLCGGTLISAKYVLTAAHCIIGPVLDHGTPTAVRLGEYDLNHEGKDCISVEGGGEDCNDGPVSIAIETTIPFPKYYYPDHPSMWNDIGLIRLKEAAPYTDFIRPICLTTKDPLENPPDHPLYAVGWNNAQNIKVLHKVPFVSHEICQPIYVPPRRKIPVALAPGQLCAGGIEGMDPCTGDGGGPLLYENPEGLSELIGIVSFGIVPCGQKDIASVYTNIYPYLDWIKTTIKK